MCGCSAKVAFAATRRGEAIFVLWGSRNGLAIYNRLRATCPDEKEPALDIVWLKFLHVSAISIWCAGLVSLPGLYVQRAHIVERDAVDRLQNLVRFAYVVLVSPAAFIAIATGIGLIFLRETFEPWFSLKLAFVGVLVFIHAMTGLVIIRLFDDGEIYPVWRFVATTIATAVVVAVILALVLGKPAFPPDILPRALSEPGGLRRIFEGFIPWVRR